MQPPPFNEPGNFGPPPTKNEDLNQVMITSLIEQHQKDMERARLTPEDENFERNLKESRGI
jgi:hypothetical protein